MKKKTNIAVSDSKKERDENSQTRINKIALQDLLNTADKLSINLTDNAVIKKMIPYFLLKFDLSDIELRKLFKVALHKYRALKETALEKVGLLTSEQRYEVFMRLKNIFLEFFNPIFNSDSTILDNLSKSLDEFLDQYLPQMN
jgi:hypothetical protein